MPLLECDRRSQIFNREEGEGAGAVQEQEEEEQARRKRIIIQERERTSKCSRCTRSSQQGCLV